MIARRKGESIGKSKNNKNVKNIAIYLNSYLKQQSSIL